MHRHRQLHLWITEHDYARLRQLADDRQETVSAVIRRLIKLHHGHPGEIAPPVRRAAVRARPDLRGFVNPGLSL